VEKDDWRWWRFRRSNECMGKILASWMILILFWTPICFLGWLLSGDAFCHVRIPRFLFTFQSVNESENCKISKILKWFKNTYFQIVGCLHDANASCNFLCDASAKLFVRSSPFRVRWWTDQISGGNIAAVWVPSIRTRPV
jgi:hypothetical protein